MSEKVWGTSGFHSSELPRQVALCYDYAHCLHGCWQKQIKVRVDPPSSAPDHLRTTSGVSHTCSLICNSLTLGSCLPSSHPFLSGHFLPEKRHTSAPDFCPPCCRALSWHQRLAESRQPCCQLCGSLFLHVDPSNCMAKDSHTLPAFPLF